MAGRGVPCRELSSAEAAATGSEGLQSGGAAAGLGATHWLLSALADA
jgi:hypothetical protein